MLLQKISVTQFRNFSFDSFDFKAPVIGITGLNGAGKTNLLDAVYYLCYTKSYFQSREINNVQTGTNGFRIEGAFEHHYSGTLEAGASLSFGEGRGGVITNTEETIVCKWKEGKKIVEHDGIPYEKITEHIGKYTAVMIAPDDIELINEGSELRRKFIDGLLSQSDAPYLEHLLQYQKLLAQRNAYLRQTSFQQIAHDLLDVYDEQLAYHGAYLIQEREQLSAKIPEWVQRYYASLSGGSESIGLQYRCCTASQPLPELLKRSRQRDIEYKRTLSGPHTEDWLFTIEESPLKAHASQGQKKSFLISLKLAHIHWLQQLGKSPFLLLDDIFEKLDRSRLLRLFEMLQQFDLSQIFMTHTSAEDLLQTVNKYYKEVQLVKL